MRIPGIWREPALCGKASEDPVGLQTVENLAERMMQFLTQGSARA